LLDKGQIDKFIESETKPVRRRRPEPDPQLVEEAQRQKAASQSILWGEGAVIADLENALIKREILRDSKQWNDAVAAWTAERKRKRLPI
jgi:hypothetical protein